MKKLINVGNVIIGNDHIVIQSMTNTKTSNIEATINQIKNLQNAGCEIVRVAVKDEIDALAIKKIKENIQIPLVADIHYDSKLAILSIENGADKIRINPGNTKINELTQIVNKAKEYNIPIRIGVNSGSLSQEILEKYGNTAKALVEETKKCISLLESLDFFNIVISIKATNIKDFIEANQEIDKLYNYPLHIGLTESGPLLSGSIRSSYAIGKLLENNIGNTIRVSLTGNPVNEIYAAKEILKMFNKYSGATLISCPTCGRCEYNMDSVIDELLPFIYSINKPLKIAIMGCVVNGIGEGKEADFGIAGGKEQAVIFKKGEIIKKVPQNEICEEFKNIIIESLK